MNRFPSGLDHFRQRVENTSFSASCSAIFVNHTESCAILPTARPTGTRAQPLLWDESQESRILTKELYMYFIMLCWTAAIVLVTVAFMRRLW